MLISCRWKTPISFLPIQFFNGLKICIQFMQNFKFFEYIWHPNWNGLAFAAAPSLAWLNATICPQERFRNVHVYILNFFFLLYESGNYKWKFQYIHKTFLEMQICFRFLFPLRTSRFIFHKIQLNDSKFNFHLHYTML